MAIAQQVHTENISPKQRFQRSGVRLSQHRDMVASDPFIMGCETALLEYQAKITSQITDGNTAMAAGFRLMGAQELVNTIRALADTTTNLKVVVNDNLKAQ